MPIKCCDIIYYYIIYKLLYITEVYMICTHAKSIRIYVGRFKFTICVWKV